MQNLNILPNPNTKKKKTAVAVLLSAVAFAANGCATEKINDKQTPIVVPASAKDLGPDTLNDKNGNEVLSGRSFQVPAESAKDIICPDLSFTHEEPGSSYDLMVSPIRKVDIYPTDASKLVIRCLYDASSYVASDIPVTRDR